MNRPVPLCLAAVLAGSLLAVAAAAQSTAPVPSPSTPPVPLPDSPGAKAWRELDGQLKALGAIQSVPRTPDQTVESPPPVPWPGLSRIDVPVALNLLAQARVVVLQSPGGAREAVWIKSLRGRRLANGWYGILLNGQEIPLESLYILYGGREVNVRQLMTWGSRSNLETAPFSTGPH